MSETYTIKELQALPDADLNALAAELRGWFLRREVWLESQNGQEVTVAATLNAYFDLRRSYPVWQPATDRNQSGELLEWAAETQNIIFTIAFHPEGASRGFIWYGLHRKPYESVQGNTARAETVAFCAAMLAMAGRLK